MCLDRHLTGPPGGGGGGTQSNPEKIGKSILSHWKSVWFSLQCFLWGVKSRLDMHIYSTALFFSSLYFRHISPTPPPHTHTPTHLPLSYIILTRDAVGSIAGCNFWQWMLQQGRGRSLSRWGGGEGVSVLSTGCTWKSVNSFLEQMRNSPFELQEKHFCTWTFHFFQGIFITAISSFSKSCAGEIWHPPYFHACPSFCWFGLLVELRKNY